MAQTKPTSIFHQVQQLIADQLNSDEMLSAANVTFVAENSKDIDYEVQNALGKQGIIGLVMTPKADYIGITARGEVAYDLRDLTIQIVENVPVNRGLPNSTTALDAAQRAQEILASPNFTTFGVMNPVNIEQGEDSGLIVCQAKFNCNVHARYIKSPKTTKVKYTAASGLPEYEELVVGELSSIPNPGSAEELNVGNAVSAIAASLFGWNALSLTSVVLPDSVASIGQGAFNGCRALVSITMPSRMSSIGSEAFYFCQKLEHITVPEGVTKIEDQTFSVCDSLTSISLPSSLSSIGELAFSGDSSLASATIPAAVESIGQNAFYNCSALTSFTLEGKTLEQIQAMENYPWGIADTGIIVGDTQPVEWIPGGYRSGGDTTPGVLYTPDYISVEKNHNITWKWGDTNIGAGVQAYLMTYNDDKQIVTYWSPNGATGQRTFNVGADASYLRYSVIAGFQDTTFVKDETTGRYLVKNGKIIF